MFKLFQKIADSIKNYLSISVLIIIVLINLFYTSFIYSSWYPVIVDNEILMSFIKLVIGIVLICLLLFITNKLNRKTQLMLIILINVSALLIKIYLIYSIKNYPVHDSWHMLNSINQIQNNTFDSILPGGYLSTHKHQLGLATVLYPIVKLFGYNAQPIFVLQSVLVQISLSLFSLSLFFLKGIKSAFFSSVLLNLFLPNIFSVFLFYGDIYSLFFLSIAFLLFSITLKFHNKKIKYSLYFAIYILLSFSYFARVTTGVFIIALIILIIISGELRAQKFILIFLLASIFIIPNFLNETYYKETFKYDLVKNSLPNNTWLRIGTSYSSWDDKSAGFYDVQVNYDFTSLNFDHYKMEELNKRIIYNQINGLLERKELYEFIKNKLTIAWADADFEMATLLIPFSGLTFERITIESSTDLYGTGAFDLKATNQFGEFLINNYFNIRNIEKIFVFGILFLTVINFLLGNKYIGIKFLQITLIGMFLYMILFEVKSRYLWVFFNLWIVLISINIENLICKIYVIINDFQFFIKKRN